MSLLHYFQYEMVRFLLLKVRWELAQEAQLTKKPVGFEFGCLSGVSNVDDYSTSFRNYAVESKIPAKSDNTRAERKSGALDSIIFTYNLIYLHTKQCGGRMIYHGRFVSNILCELDS